MPNTPKYALPYPPPTGVAPDVPYYMQQLAEGVEAQLDYARDPHHAVVRPTAVQSIPDTTTTRLLYGVTVSVESMTVNLAGGSVTTTRAGLYLVVAGLGLSAGTIAGYRQLIINQGAGQVAAQTHPPHTAGNFLNVSAIVRAAVGDAFTVDINQTSGAAINTFGFTDRTFLSVARLGD